MENDICVDVLLRLKFGFKSLEHGFLNGFLWDFKSVNFEDYYKVYYY